MKIDKGLEKVSDLLKRKSKPPPAYPWQELALRVIMELSIPNKKRNSVFKVCKGNTRLVIEKCLSDTKELCQTGERWRYFFKLIGGGKK